MSRGAHRRSLAALASAAALLALPASAAAGLTEFTAGFAAGDAPADIASGPDGNLWFTEQGLLPGVGRMTPAGDVTEYPVAALQEPGEITAGPDGALWFTERGPAEAIGRIAPSDGSITEFPLGAGSRPTGITTGPDGALWFTEKGTGKLGRISTTGDLTEVDAHLDAGDTLDDVAAGPDGNLWVTVAHDASTAAGVAKIVRYKPSTGELTRFSTGLTSMTPNQIVAASNGKLYFTESDNPAGIGRIKTDGTIREYRTGVTADSQPTALAEGGDGAVWFTSGAGPGRLGRMTMEDEQVTEFTGGLDLGLTPDAGPAGITRGPDGNIWFAGSSLPGRIGQVTLAPFAELLLKQITARQSVTDGQLQATIGANSQATTYHVEYGPDETYGQRTPDAGAGAGAGRVTESVALPLDPSSHYHARLVARNASGESASADLPLWTDATGRLLDFDPATSAPAPSVTPEPTATPTPAPGSSEQAHAAHGLETTPAMDHLPVSPPVLGESVVVHPLTGSVRVKAPTDDRYHPLAGGAQLPVGTMVDARAGKIVLQSARDAHGRTQSGTFWGSVFQIRQRRNGRGVTDLILRGGRFGDCSGSLAHASVLARDPGGRRRVVRRLWGKDHHSRFRTHGRDSVATVRGTRWVTTDRCDGTLTRVTTGKVSVRDVRRRRSVLVSAGHAYLARHRSR